MVGKTAAERKAAERARRATEGLQRFETWLYPKEWERVRRFIERHILPKRKESQSNQTTESQNEQ